MLSTVTHYGKHDAPRLAKSLNSQPTVFFGLRRHHLLKSRLAESSDRSSKPVRRGSTPLRGAKHEIIMKKEVIYVGKGEDGTSPVVSGLFIFRLVDTIGLPFDIVIQELKDRQIAFDVIGFVQAAKNSKNYTPKRLRALFNENRPIDDKGFDDLIDFVIGKIYGDGV